MKNYMPHLTTAGLALMLGLASASAQSISITNPSFEANSGYSGGTTSSVIGWQANSFPIGLGTYGSVDDVSAAFTSGLSGTNAFYIGGNIAQLTAATFETGRTYTLSFDIGKPTGAGPTTDGFQFGFINNANTAFIAGGESFVAVNDLTAGAFQTYSVAYTAVSGDNGNTIRIGATDFFASSATYRIDNVQLSASAIPEPSTFAAFVGIAAIGLATLRRRRA
ncbi:MAG: PEP-CTERM sorting domain-containing protein [Opitutus sp.]|nr:PEP-CTERM sorting domain-containing protein [Opitutus sp.]MCS6246589.1 PEP-CTERM sorting domain-containing protein [Opitutus sp.]MCS6274082.1 PEP-CTERM sorting domain-containing protein [Opitutus sp.]MCS6276358.1 PEP-CTERM sorting domain-containing protein [Opitutus sp.]MCS6301994.1 PEP-CTERM sorting domain-containing protein [Opitutus sp.]